MSRKNLAKSIQNLESPKYSGTQELVDSEMGLIGYSTEIVRKFFYGMNMNENIIKHNGSLLEFGAGTGFLAKIFMSQFGIKPDCIELDPKLITVIRNHNLKCHQFIHEISQSYDAIYTSNVLEHIEDDSAILSELYDSLKPGGVLGVYVPANPILYSAMDKEIGHVRRYTRSELKKKVESAGFAVQKLNYDDFIGFFASGVVKIIGYKNKANLGSKRSLIIYDKAVYPASRLLDKLGLRYLLGKNLFLVAVKPK